MVSTLLRLTARRGSALRGVVSSAAAVPSGWEGLAVRRTVSLPSSPLRRLMCSGVRGDQPPVSPHEKVEQLQQKVKEIDEQLDKELIRILKMYKEALQDPDSGYFDRFLSLGGAQKQIPRWFRPGL